MNIPRFHRYFPPLWDEESIARWLRRQAMRGFQRADDEHTGRYVMSCGCGVNLPEYPNSIGLILTRDINPDCLIGWHLSVCCVTYKGYRGYVPAEGEHWRQRIFGHYAELAIPQPLEDRSEFGREKDVRHWIIECDFADQSNPVASL